MLYDINGARQEIHESFFNSIKGFLDKHKHIITRRVNELDGIEYKLYPFSHTDVDNNYSLSSENVFFNDVRDLLSNNKNVYIDFFDKETLYFQNVFENNFSYDLSNLDKNNLKHIYENLLFNLKPSLFLHYCVRSNFSTGIEILNHNHHWENYTNNEIFQEVQTTLKFFKYTPDSNNKYKQKLYNSIENYLSSLQALECKAEESSQAFILVENFWESIFEITNFDRKEMHRFLPYFNAFSQKLNTNDHSSNYISRCNSSDNMLDFIRIDREHILSISDSIFLPSEGLTMIEKLIDFLDKAKIDGIYKLSIEEVKAQHVDVKVEYLTESKKEKALDTIHLLFPILIKEFNNIYGNKQYALLHNDQYWDNIIQKKVLENKLIKDLRHNYASEKKNKL